MNPVILTNVAGEERAAPVDVQLQLTFGEIEVHGNRLKELKANMKRRYEAAEGYVEKKQVISDAQKEVQRIEEVVQGQNSEIVQEMNAVKAKIDASAAAMNVLATHQFKNEGKVEFITRDGKLVTADPKFKFKNHGKKKPTGDAEDDTDDDV